LKLFKHRRYPFNDIPTDTRPAQGPQQATNTPVTPPVTPPTGQNMGIFQGSGGVVAPMAVPTMAPVVAGVAAENTTPDVFEEAKKLTDDQTISSLTLSTA